MVSSHAIIRMVFTSKKSQSFLWPGWASQECQHQTLSLGLADLWAAPSQCPFSFRAMSAHCDAEVVEQCQAVLLHPALSWLSSTQKHLLLKKCEERSRRVILGNHSPVQHPGDSGDPFQPCFYVSLCWSQQPGCEPEEEGNGWFD